MKKALLIFVFCGLFSQVLISQIVNIDSLVKILPSIKNDSIKFEALYQITKELNYQYSNKVENYKAPLIDQAEKVNTLYAKGKAFNAIANYYYNFAQIDSSLYYFKKALLAFQKGNHEKGEIDALFNLGSVYVESRNFTAAQKHLDSIYLYAVEKKDSTLIFDYYQSSGHLNDNKGSYDKAMNFHILALDMASQIKDEVKISAANTNLGFIHYAIGNPELAYSYYYTAYRLDVKNGRKYRLPVHYQNIGLTFDAREEFDSALYYYQKAAELNMEVGDEPRLARNYNNIGVVYFLKEEYKEAKEYYLKALTLKEKATDLHDIASSQLNLGDVNVALGNYNKAKFYLDKGLKISYDLNSLYLKQIANNYYSNYFEKKGFYKKALEHFKVHKFQMDSLLNEEKLSIIEGYEIQYDTKQKEDSIKYQSVQLLLNEKEVEVSNRQLENRKNVIIGIGIFATLLIAFLIFLQRKNKTIELVNNQLQLEKHQVETLLTEGRHRIKNNLMFAASILDLHAKDTDDKNVESAVSEGRNRIEAMGLLHQKLLYESKGQALIEMQSYLKDLVQNLSLAHDPQSKISLSLQVDPIKLDVEKAMRIGLIINELVTNAYKHLPVNAKDPKIDIVLKGGQRLQLLIQDNGGGLPINFELKKEKSFGLQLVELLTKQMNGKLNIKNTPGVRYELDFN